MENRIIDLEMKVSHLEKYLDELNNVVVEQYKLLDKQKKEIEKLNDMIVDNNSGINTIKNEKPPHY